MVGYHPQAVLRVTGDDAFSFLQGQFTNELRQPVGSATYGLWLNQKGKILADSQVLRLGENEFLVTSIASTVEVVRARLEEYIVADEVFLADETAGTQGLAMAGAGSGAAVQLIFGGAPASGKFLTRGRVVVFGGRRSADENYELLGPGEELEECRRLLRTEGAQEISPDEMDFERIAAGIPAVPADLGAADLPNEGGLEGPAISFTKGCYLGQEVMARLKNLGQVRRRLHVVHGPGQPPAPLTPLYQAGKKVGELRTAAVRGGDFVALAMLSLINFNPAAGLGLDPAGPAVLRVDRHG